MNASRLKRLNAFGALENSINSKLRHFCAYFSIFETPKVKAQKQIKMQVIVVILAYSFVTFFCSFFSNSFWHFSFVLLCSFSFFF